MTPRRSDNQHDELERQIGTLMGANLDLLVTHQRGVLDHEALARRFIRDHDLSATEREVVRTIRRFEPTADLDVEGALELLARTPVSLGEDLALIKLESEPEELGSIQDVLRLFTAGDAMGVAVHGEGGSLIVPQRLVDAALEVLGVPEDRVIDGLTHVYVTFPEEGSHMQLAGATVLHALDAEGIERIRTFRNLSTLTFLVPVDEADRAAGIIRGLGAAYRDDTDDP